MNVILCHVLMHDKESIKGYTKNIYNLFRFVIC